MKTFFWKYSHNTVVRGTVDPYGDDDAIICTSRPEMSNVSTVNKQHSISNHFTIAEVDKADFCEKQCEGTCREDRTTHPILRTSRPNKESAQHTSSLAFSYS